MMAGAEDKRALIIGCSDGIGLALVKRLLAEGWQVTGLSRRPSPLEHPRYWRQVRDVAAAGFRASLTELVTSQGPFSACVYCADIGARFAPANLARRGCCGAGLTRGGPLPKMRSMNNLRAICTVWLSLFCLGATAQEKVIRLYEGPAPGSENWTHQEKENSSNSWQTRVVFNVVNPTLTVVSPEPGAANGAAVVICPGGAFYALSIDSEGLGVARWLAAKGVTCFVLKYRLVECTTDDPTREVMAMGEKLDQVVAPIVKLATADGKAAIRYVRQHAKEYGVNPERIGIIGFSAGGTVTAAVGFNYDADSRPNFVAPIYLEYDWVGKVAVPADAPPMFILAASDDPLGLAPHSLRLYQDWTAAKKTAELHLYSKGGHGFGMRKQGLPSDRWIERFADWLETQGFLKK